jgi:hypothetical protein
MKKLLVLLGVVLLMTVAPQKTKAQLPLVDIIGGAIKKVIRAADLQIQRQQNKVIWLQNAQKTLENQMSKLKLGEISEWTEKQKELYRSYYDELQKVKVVISYYQKIRDVTNVQLRIVREYKSGWSAVQRDKHFSNTERDHISSVYSGILDESLKNLDQLYMVANSFQTQMTDAQRLELIDDAAGKMDMNYRDLRLFNRQNATMSLSRVKAKQDLDLIKKLYGLK